MTKRRSQPGGETGRARVKRRVGLHDDGGQQVSDVEMDTPSGRVASHVDSDLGVTGQPDSEMVEDIRELDDHAALDAQFNDTIQLEPPDSQELRELLLLGILAKIAEQNDHTINPQDLLKAHEWLQDFLITQWQNKSFTNVRRLSEYPQYTFSVNNVA